MSPARRRPLRVYGWTAYRPDLSAASGGQVRMVVAAHSQAEVARLAGERRPSALFCLGETGNVAEQQAAKDVPGVLLWRSLDARPGDPLRPDPKQVTP